jgi:hypothetical protein
MATGSRMNESVLFVLLAKQGEAIFAWSILSWIIVRHFFGLE